MFKRDIVRFYELDGTSAGGSTATPPDDSANKKLAELQAEIERLNAEKTSREKADADAKKKKEEDDLKARNDYAALAAKVEADRVALEDERKRLAIETEMTKASVKNGLRKDSFLALVDRSGIEFKDGRVTGVDKAFEKLKKDSPELFGEEKSAGGGSDRTPRPGGATSKFLDDLMKKAEERRKPAVPKGWNK